MLFFWIKNSIDMFFSIHNNFDFFELIELDIKVNDRKQGFNGFTR